MALDWVKEKELKEKATELRDEAEGLLKTVDSEKRNLTDKEQERFNAIEEEHQRIAAQIENANRLGGFNDSLNIDARTMDDIGRDTQPGNDLADQPISNRITIPVENRFRYGSLKAYSGPKAEEKAYIAGRFFLGTLCKHEASAKWCAENGINVKFRNALSGSDNALGGFLVPTEMEQAIIDLRELYGVFRREARQVPMASDTKNHARRTSGLTAFFSGDNEGLTESEKSWDNVQLIAKKLHCLTKYSTEISEDSIISIGDDLTQEIAYAFSLKEDQCGFLGDGSSTYGGIVGIVNALLAGSVHSAASGNTGFETLDLTDFETAVGKLKEYPGIQPKWYISKAGYWASMARLADAAGGQTSEHVANGPPQRVFLGYPVVISQVLNKTLGVDADAPKAIFGDLRMGVAFGNRRGISVMVSEHRYFENDQIGIKGTQRFDLNVHEKGTATEAGAIVVLKSAAS